MWFDVFLEEHLVWLARMPGRSSRNISVFPVMSHWRHIWRKPFLWKERTTMCRTRLQSRPWFDVPSAPKSVLAIEVRFALFCSYSRASPKTQWDASSL